MDDFLRLTYNGTKPYRDRLVELTWKPGDTKVVPFRAGRKLLKFGVFAVAEGAATEAEQTQAALQQQQLEQDDQQQQDILEAQLMDIDTMDKGALEQLARKYTVELDKRKSLDNLRTQVRNLVEERGVL